MTTEIPIRLKESTWKKLNPEGEESILLEMDTYHKFRRLTPNQFDNRITMTFFFKESFIHMFFGTARALPLGREHAYIYDPARRAIFQKIVSEAKTQLAYWKANNIKDIEVASGVGGGKLGIDATDFEFDDEKDIHFVRFDCMHSAVTKDVTLRFMKQRRAYKREREARRNALREVDWNIDPLEPTIEEELFNPFGAPMEEEEEENPFVPPPTIHTTNRVIPDTFLTSFPILSEKDIEFFLTDYDE